MRHLQQAREAHEGLTLDITIYCGGPGGADGRSGTAAGTLATAAWVCTACSGACWMPAAMRCLHDEDGARAKSGQSHVPINQVIHRGALTLAGYPGMAIREDLDIAGGRRSRPLSRRGHDSGKVALARKATCFTAARKACLVVCSNPGRCLFPGDLMNCYHWVTFLLSVGRLMYVTAEEPHLGNLTRRGPGDQVAVRFLVVLFNRLLQLPLLLDALDMLGLMMVLYQLV